ncbi:MAG: amino acid dehydrogenase [Panacagrimonas sp.]|jgi:leucine dehydrogenase|nr:Glu/Leu/Phe/Val dehydrogenase dimerization domain-containing protein [Panacagrimonas sp.]MCC2657141.1 amino acid dehydrogenase [Panacagrimonas sp.]
MSGVLTHPEYDDHELVAFHRDPGSGLRAVVAVHSTVLGRGLGGCRVHPYASEADAITDVLRLSRGMTYKAALAGLQQGGGKAVVIADPRLDKTPAMMRAMGRLVQTLGGRYVIAEDSGTDEADMREVAHETAFIGGGAAPINPDDPGDRDTSAATALGVYFGIQAAVRFRLGREDLRGLRVSIQGVGKVGQVLAQHLHDAGARLFVCDAYAPAVDACVQRFGATPVDARELIGLDVDVFSPCALGAVFDDDSVPRLRAPIVAGAANNQLAEPRHGGMLMDRGVLYAPDYAINAGGIINLYYEGPTRRWADVEAHLQRIGRTLDTIFMRARDEVRPTHEIADRMAETVFRKQP